MTQFAICQAIPLRRSGPMVALILSGFALVGCSDPRGAEVAGKVTFAGKPVPRGRIYFTPDVTKDNDGPQGYAEIRAGEFDTRKSGKGAYGGPTVVVIQGYDGVAGDNPGSVGSRLFAEYEVAIDLPKEDSTRDFDVPASAAAGLTPRVRKGKGP